MRGLTIIVAGADPARLHAALSLAAAQAALDRPARIFLQGDAVGLLRQPLAAPDDARHSAAGLPTLAELLHEAAALGVTVTACQSGLALAGLQSTDLPDGVATGGLVELLATGGDDQLLLA
ncbi:MAG TPA: DsrE family protein [Allosphingosinicella sp.]|nr:DsrE family protein [Allosphingosinicella sp.]